MPVRLAACDPCRLSKVSCDHAMPCGRCRDGLDITKCTYRQRPFKRRRTQQGTSLNPQTSTSPSRAESSPSITSIVPSYPNPGYQGTSSHTSIFEQVKANGGAEDVLDQSQSVPLVAPGGLEDYEKARHTQLLEDISLLDVQTSARLISHWISQGINLALAGPIVMPCVESVDKLFSTRSQTELVAMLFQSSRRRASSDADMPISTFAENCCRSDPGWATLGMFLVALSRASDDTDSFLPLYSTQAGRRRLQKLALHHADQCLEICLSLDCLNDLQLILQYENFIAHSMIDGDQSYHSWRRLGDVVSSIYALGYHERVNLAALGPTTLGSLRNAAFCRAYSADKNVSIFLGRPPRMHRNHSSLGWSSEVIQHLFHDFSSHETFEYVQETRWTVACAVLKERVLDLAQVSDAAIREDDSRAILQDCEALGAALPSGYHISGHLKNFLGSPIERDFVASAALNLLHVRFLLHSSYMQDACGPNDELIGVSAAMLKLAAEVAVLKPTLANSGTGFIWKIVFYGLPAAGIICLALVSRGMSSSQSKLSVSQAMQDLNVLVAHVEAGVLICSDEPNYALLQAATMTIKSVVQRLTLGSLSINLQSETQTNLWMPWAGHNEALDFELDFWTNLADHPALYDDTA